MNFETTVRGRRWPAWLPPYRSMNVADLINTATKAPLADVGAAIKSGDAVQVCRGLRTASANLQRLPSSTNHTVVHEVPKASGIRIRTLGR